MNPNDLVRNGCYHYLGAYASYMEAEFMRPSHIQMIIDHLVKVESGEIKKLIINMPPRHGKSMLTSKIFPTWFLGRNPNKNVIFTTYGQEFAEDFGRYVRNVIQKPEFLDIFPDANLSSDSTSVKRFALDKGGNYFAVGAGGSITGRGADLAIIDDPLRNRAEANSPNIRRRILDWYKSTLFTRLSPEGRIILIQTRWHSEDLAGYIIENEKDEWVHLNMPAISDDGHALWPEYWGLDKLAKIKNAIGSYEWAALYQQQPAPQDEGIFNKAWFEIVNAKTIDNVKSIRYWDRAATVKKDGNDPDWTVGVKMSRTKDGLFYIEDVVRLRASSLDVQKAIHNTAVRDGTRTVVGLEQDPGQAGKSEVEYLTRMLAGFNVKTFKVTKDKITRASPLSAQCEAGNVKLLKGSWVEDFLDELQMFPFGKHDDQTDAAAGALNYLTEDRFSYRDMVKW